MSIKKVWEIIKNFNCAELAIVQEPAMAVWQEQQKRIDELDQRATGLALDQMETAKLNAELQAQIDSAKDVLSELNEKSEALHHRWNILSDSVALAEAEAIDMCIKDLEQALKGDMNEQHINR